MKTIQKQTVTVLATIALFSSAALADGEMGGGGLTTYDPPAQTVITQQNGQVVSDNTTNADGYGINWLLHSIEQLLGIN